MDCGVFNKMLRNRGLGVNYEIITQKDNRAKTIENYTERGKSPNMLCKQIRIGKKKKTPLDRFHHLSLKKALTGSYASKSRGQKNTPS